MKHQWGIGSWPVMVSEPFIEIHYKTFFHKKKFYNISIAGWYNLNESTPTYDHFDYTIIPSVEIGISLPFFKICRFNAAARTSFFLREFETEYKNGKEDYNYVWVGGFLGPNLGLEIIPIKTQKFMLSMFGYLHAGFGYMHKKHSRESTLYDSGYSNGIDKSSIGVGAIGIAIRY